MIIPVLVISSGYCAGALAGAVFIRRRLLFISVQALTRRTQSNRCKTEASTKQASHRSAICVGVTTLKKAVDGHNKAQKPQDETGGVVTIATKPARIFATAKPYFPCAFCSFSWLIAFSKRKHPAVRAGV